MNLDHPYVKVASYEPRADEVKRVVLLYSGGLDTSVMLKWIQDVYHAEIIALTVDIGQQADDMEKIRQKALDLGAIKALVVDAKDEFAERYISRAIKANASYQGMYHLSTPVGRPLLAKIAVQVAGQEGADTIAHGATGKGNDQVRIEGSALALNPDIKIIAPVREWAMGRDEEIEYAKKHHIPISQTSESPYSYDDNMWGVTGESGEIEDPEKIPPLEKILQVCTLPQLAPDEPELVQLEFVKGLPVAINGKTMKLADLIMTLNTMAARHGVGISHHLEDRIVGLKVRGLYEMPAGHTIIVAHRDLEKYVCTRYENEFKETVDQKWAYLCYGALWYEPLMENLNAYIDKVNEKVSGVVTLRWYKGNCDVVAIKGPNIVFDAQMATFMKSDVFNQNASPGFIEIYTLQMKLAKQIQKNILLTIGMMEDKEAMVEPIRELEQLNVRLFATQGTHQFLVSRGIVTQLVHKTSEEMHPNIRDYLYQRRFDLIINIPRRKNGDSSQEMTDGAFIRTEALKQNIRLVTDLDVARQLIDHLVHQHTG